MTWEIAVVPIEAFIGDEIVHLRTALELYTVWRNTDGGTYRPVGGTYLES